MRSQQFHMMLHAVELKDATTKFHEQPLNYGREGAYMPVLDTLDDLDWAEVIEYLSLLRHFVETIVHLEGNAKADRDHGARGAIWKVIPWLQIMSTKIEKAIAKEDEFAKRFSLGITAFGRSLEYGQKKLNKYWGNYYGYHTILRCCGNANPRTTTSMVQNLVEEVS